MFYDNVEKSYKKFCVVSSIYGRRIGVKNTTIYSLVVSTRTGYEKRVSGAIFLRSVFIELPVVIEAPRTKIWLQCLDSKFVFLTLLNKVEKCL